MSDEEILKTEKHLIDFLMQIFFWMRLHFFRSSDFSQFAKKAISTSFPSKENLSQFCRKNKSSLASSYSYSYVWKASFVRKRLKSRKTFFIVKLPVHFTVMESNGYHFLGDNQLICAKKLFSEFVNKNCSMNDLGYSDLKGDTSRK